MEVTEVAPEMEQVEVEIKDTWNNTSQKIIVKRHPISAGDMVTWFNEAQRSHAQPAIVLSVAETNIDVMVLSPDRLGMRIEGVHHIDDEKLTKTPQIKLYSGGWDYTSAHKQAYGRQTASDERILLLENRLAELEDSMTSTKPSKEKK